MFSKSDLTTRVSLLNSSMASACASPDREAAMLEVLRSEACYLVACAYAFRFTAGDPNPIEAAHDLAVWVLVPMFGKPGQFAGRSLFSTYLYGAFRRSNVQSYKEKIPKAIRDIHPLAPLVFELITRDGWRDAEVRAHLGSFMPVESARRILAAVHDAVSDHAVYLHSRFGTPTFSDLESDDDRQAGSIEARFSDQGAGDPLDHLLDKEQRRIFHELLARLDPDQKKLVREYVLERNVKTYKEASDKLGIKDPAYELRKIGSTLKEMHQAYE
jgi:RNA polymerase sigma factor (sigma-70 family)